MIPWIQVRVQISTSQNGGFGCFWMFSIEVAAIKFSWRIYSEHDACLIYTIKQDRRPIKTDFILWIKIMKVNFVFLTSLKKMVSFIQQLSILFYEDLWFHVTNVDF